MTEPAALAVLRLAAQKRRLPPPTMRRSLRESSGLSAAQVADAIGITRQALSRYERGEREPRGALLGQYLAVLDALATLD